MNATFNLQNLTRQTCRGLIGLLLSLMICSPARAQVLESFTEPIEKVEVSAAMAGVLRKLTIKPGSQIQQGQVIAELDHSVLLESKRLAKAKADANAKLESTLMEVKVEQQRLDKLLLLKKGGNASQSEIDKSQAKVAVIMKQAEAIKEEKQIYLIEVDRIQAEINQRRIVSPIAGTIVKVHKSAGEFVAAHEPNIAQIVDLDRLKAKFFVLPEQSENLRGKSKCRILLDRLNQVVTATIDYHSPITSAASGTVEIHVSFDNATGQFRSGEIARLLIGESTADQQDELGK